MFSNSSITYLAVAHPNADDTCAGVTAEFVPWALICARILTRPPRPDSPRACHTARSEVYTVRFGIGTDHHRCTGSGYIPSHPVWIVKDRCKEENYVFVHFWNIPWTPGPRCTKLTIDSNFAISSKYHGNLDFDWLLSPVTMVIAIDVKVTIYGKLNATGPCFISPRKWFSRITRVFRKRSGKKGSGVGYTQKIISDINTTVGKILFLKGGGGFHNGK